APLRSGQTRLRGGDCCARDRSGLVRLPHVETDEILQLAPTEREPVGIRLRALPPGQVAPAVEQVPRDHDRRDRIVVVAVEGEVAALEAVVECDADRGQEGGGGEADAGVRGADPGSRLRELFAM